MFFLLFLDSDNVVPPYPTCAAFETSLSWVLNELTDDATRATFVALKFCLYMFFYMFSFHIPRGNVSRRLAIEL